MAAADFERILVRTRAEWRTWLEAHHTQAESIWLVTYKKSAGAHYVSYDDQVEEALCFGWIDSRKRPVDDQRSMIIMCPRRKGSVWSESNRTRVARLGAAGLMMPAGLRKIEGAKADGSWSRLDAIDTSNLPDDLAAQLLRNYTATAHFNAWSDSYKRVLLSYIQDAKRPETRAKRIAQVVKRAELNLKRDAPFPG